MCFWLVAAEGLSDLLPSICPYFGCERDAGQAWQAASQIVVRSGLGQFVRMCSRSSTGAPQSAHFALCSRFLMCSQNFSTHRKLCIAWYRNDWTGHQMSGCRIEHQMVELVSKFAVMSWISRLVCSMLLFVVSVSGRGLDWVIAE